MNGGIAGEGMDAGRELKKRKEMRKGPWNSGGRKGMRYGGMEEAVLGGEGRSHCRGKWKE